MIDGFLILPTFQGLRGQTLKNVTMVALNLTGQNLHTLQDGSTAPDRTKLAYVYTTGCPRKNATLLVFDITLLI
jgi:hypothetical protein